MIDNWTEQFVPTELQEQDNIICLNEADHHEREGYTVNLQPAIMKMTLKLHRMKQFSMIIVFALWFPNQKMHVVSALNNSVNCSVNCSVLTQYQFNS